MIVDAIVGQHMASLDTATGIVRIAGPGMPDSKTCRELEFRLRCEVGERESAARPWEKCPCGRQFRWKPERHWTIRGDGGRVLELHEMCDCPACLSTRHRVVYEDPDWAREAGAA